MEKLTAVDFIHDLTHLDLHAEGDRLLGRSGEVGKLMMQLIVADGLRQPHQRGHLAIEDVDGPPDPTASLDDGIPQVLRRHIGVHSLGLGDPRCLANLHG